LLIIFLIVLYACLLQISLASVVGNGLVVATIARHRGMRTRTNLLLANLAAADILVGAIDMPFSFLALTKGSWVFGKPLCQFNAFTTGLALMASIHTLMFIRLVFF
jgi:7 transmembrane receptor (rhodopsin family)